MSAHSIIYEKGKVYMGATCIGDRTYIVNCKDLEVTLKVTGDLSIINVDTTVNDYSFGHYSYLLSFLLGHMGSIQAELEIQVDTFELNEKKLMVFLHSTGRASLVYDGSEKEIFSEEASSSSNNKKHIIRGTSRNIGYLSYWASASETGRYSINKLMNLGSWEETDVVLGNWCVFFDTGNGHYVKLEIVNHNISFYSKESCKGFVLKQNSTYFIIVGQKLKNIRVDYCFIRDGIAVSRNTSIVSKRFM